MKTFQQFTEEAEVINLLQLEESEIYALLERKSFRSGTALALANKLPPSKLASALRQYATVTGANVSRATRSYKLADTHQGVTKAPK